MPRILIIEDEEAIMMGLEDDFRMEGYDILLARDGEVGLSLALKEKIDIILLDVMLPKLNGIEVLKSIRKHQVFTPIIMLTAKSQEIDKVLGLEFGADDYLTKPFSPRELQARVRVQLRKRNWERQISDAKLLRYGNVSIDVEGRQVLKHGVAVKTTALEFSLLMFFITNASKVLSRRQILDSVWMDSVIVELRTVDTHVSNLRKKIEDDPANPQLIVGVRGVGYKFVALKNNPFENQN